MLTVPGYLKAEKNLSGNMLNNDWDLALQQLHVVNNCRGPMFSMLPISLKSGVFNLFAVAGRIAFIYMKYGRQ